MQHSAQSIEKKRKTGVDMREDVIRQVKAAEDQADEKIREGRAKADKITHDARHAAVEWRLEIVEAARTKAKELFETGVKDFEPELENVRQTFQEEIAKDTAQTQKVFDEVVAFVVKKFRERLGSE